jgi:hypothetical protein
MEHAHSGAPDDRAHDPAGRTPAQWYCLLAGAALLIAGLTGFIADASFDTAGGDRLDGGSLLGFEVNGWHNLVHLLSGAVLLLAAGGRSRARTVALAFGLVYGLVTIIGIVDGNDVLGLIPVNAADNVLHVALSLVGILAAVASPGTEEISSADRAVTVRTDDHEVATERGARFGRDYDPLSGRPRHDDEITRTR